jgi:hypothetical protein
VRWSRREESGGGVFVPVAPSRSVRRAGGSCGRQVPWVAESSCASFMRGGKCVATDTTCRRTKKGDAWWRSSRTKLTARIQNTDSNERLQLIGDVAHCGCREFY